MARSIVINSNPSLNFAATRSGGHLLAEDSLGRLHVVWQLNAAADSIQYAVSADAGQTWTDGAGGAAGSSLPLTPVGFSSKPTLVLDGNDTLHVIWVDGDTLQLQYRRRTSSGAWSPIDTASLAVAGATLDRPNLIITPSGALHVVAIATVGSTSNLFWAYSLDGGTTWLINASVVSGISSLRSIGFDADSANHLHAVFIVMPSQKAAYAKATFTSPGTWTWGAVDATSLNDTSVTQQGDCAVLVGPVDDVYTVWVASVASPSKLRWAKRPGGIGAWSLQRNAVFNTTTSTSYDTPILGLTPDGNLYLAFRQLLDNSTNFTCGFTVGDTSAGAFHNFPYVAQSFGGKHDVYGEEVASKNHFPQVIRQVRPGKKVIYAVYTDETNKQIKFTTFNARYEIAHAEPAGNSLSLPENAVFRRTSPTTFHLVFQKTTTPIQLLYKKSTDGGNTWTDGEGGAANSSFLLDTPSATRQGPNMGIDSLGNIFVAWSDITATSSLYVRRRINGAWQPLDSATFSVAGKDLRNPLVFVDKFDNVHVLARNRTDNTLYHAYSTDHGDTWTVNPAAAALTSSTRFGVGWARVDRDAANNLHLITQDVSPTNATKQILAYLSAMFTPPNTWAWGTLDRTSFEHPDDLEDVFSSFDISGNYADTATNRLDIVWTSSGAGGTENRTTLLHGTIIGGTRSFTVLGTFTNATYPNQGRPLVNGLARDVAGSLYGLLPFRTLSGTLFVTVLTLPKGQSTWQGLSPTKRLANGVGVAVIEPRPLFASPGDVYAVFQGNLVSGDDHNTILLEPVIEGLVVKTTVTQVINSDSEITLTAIVPRIKDLLASALLVKAALLDWESRIAVTQTIPSAPTLLTATDLKLGDSVRLVWAGTGPHYNVLFRKTGDPIFTKVNGTPLPGSQTQYDVGGLTTGVSYTFLVRGINGAGVEGPDSNQLAATPTLDLSLSKFSSPAWSVRINGAANPEAILTTVELGFGSDVSNAVFVIQKDPDAGGFPVYNDSVEIVVNGRTILKGKIKGITSRIGASGLTKTFTVISNITRFQEKVVPVGKDVWNVDRDEHGNVNPKVNAPTILQTILGFIPLGIPDEFPGEAHLTDQTLLDATETVLRKLGNFKLFFNQDTEQLEVYTFGEGGNVTRQFIRGANILEFSITENRQDVVDTLTLIGPPREIRVERVLGFVQDLDLTPDGSGVLRPSFTLSEPNARDIQVVGTWRDRPTVGFDERIQVLPEDMGFIPTGFSQVATWPTSFFTSAEIGTSGGDSGFRPGVKAVFFPGSVIAPVSISVKYQDKTSVRVFIAEVPKVYDISTISSLVDAKKIGVIIGEFTPSTIPVTVLQSVHWVAGGMKVRLTHDGDRPVVTVGSGPVERTITDSQYQIVIDNVDHFSNEADVFQLMQKRVESEFARLNKPKISGTITVIGDETIDLKSTVIVNGEKLDVVKVTHDFTNGFTTQVALTNEPFVATVVGTVPREERRRQSERTASLGTRITFLDNVEVDKNIVALRQQEFQKRIQQAGNSFAVYQD